MIKLIFDVRAIYSAFLLFRYILSRQYASIILWHNLSLVTSDASILLISFFDDTILTKDCDIHVNIDKQVI